MKIVKLISLVTLLTGASSAYGMREALVKFESATEATQKVAAYDEISAKLANASLEELTKLCGILKINPMAFDFEDATSLVYAKRTLVAKIKSAKIALGRVATSKESAADSVEATKKAVEEFKAKLAQKTKRCEELEALVAQLKSAQLKK